MHSFNLLAFFKIYLFFLIIFFNVQIDFIVVHVICHNYMGEPNFDEPISEAVLFTNHGEGGYDVDTIPIS